MGTEKKKRDQFVIKVGDVYYMTDGKLLVYDPADATTDKEKEGCEKMKEAFAKEEAADHTWYRSVDFTSVDFDGKNTGEELGPGGP